MTANRGKQASPNHPLITDQTASLQRRRFRRIKSVPQADSFSYNDKHIDETIPLPKPVFHPSYAIYKKLAVILLAYFAAGTHCFHLTGHQISGTKTNSVLDALYFTVVTITAVGYGDLVPASTLTILLAYVIVVSGMLIVALVLTKAAELLVDKQERLLETALHLNETMGEEEILQKMKPKRARNKFITPVVLLLVLMAAGTSLLLWVEDLGVLHTFYCVTGTLTGSGYVDKCFSTKGGRAFALVWIIATTVFLAQLLFTFASVYTDRKQRLIIQWILKRKPTVSDLEAADLDGDGIVVAAEFIVYKLKEMGKINEDDIAPIMDEFETIDFDNSEMFSASEIMFFQSSHDVKAPLISSM